MYIVLYWIALGREEKEGVLFFEVVNKRDYKIGSILGLRVERSMFYYSLYF